MIIDLIHRLDLFQGILSVAILNGCLIIIYDWLYKAIPLYLVVLFAGLSVMYGGMIHIDWQTVASIAGGSFVLLLCFVYKKMLGLADCFLIPCCFAWIDVNQIPLFLILCGVFGIATAVFWRKYYGEQAYPFMPAILFSLSILLVS